MDLLAGGPFDALLSAPIAFPPQMAAPDAIEQWKQLASVVFPTPEAMITAVKRLAASQHIQIRITFKTKEHPERASGSYKGAMSFKCQRIGCLVEIKVGAVFGGGWQIRPLDEAGMSSRSNITSWVLCNHPKDMLIPPEPRWDYLTSWDAMANTTFASADDFMNAAHAVGAATGVTLSLATLMIVDGKEKPDGRGGTYIPRGFVTLECSDKGCPMVIKGRETDDNHWRMRPWKTKEQTIKGASSFIRCVHGAEAQAEFAKKLRKIIPKRKLTDIEPSPNNPTPAPTLKLASNTPILPKPAPAPTPPPPPERQPSQMRMTSQLPSPPHIDNLPQMSPNPQYDPNLQRPQLVTHSSTAHLQNLAHLSSTPQLSSLQSSFDPYSGSSFNRMFEEQLAQMSFGFVPNNIFVPNDQMLGGQDQYGPASPPLGGVMQQQQQMMAPPPQPQQQQPLQQHHFYLPSPAEPTSPVPLGSSMSAAKLALDTYNNTLRELTVTAHSMPPLSMSMSAPAAPPSSSSSTSEPPAKRKRGRPRKEDPRKTALLAAQSHSSSPNGLASSPLMAQPSPLQILWSTFLQSLDPIGRLASLVWPLCGSGIDPAAMLGWGADDVRAFTDSVAPGVPVGVRMHFCLCLKSDGRRCWQSMTEEN